jgi:hypothetical protein
MLIAAPPDTYALLVRPLAEDHTKLQWQLETVVAFDAEDGGAFVVGGLNTTGRLVRLDAVAGECFEVRLFEAQSRDDARAWAADHVKLLEQAWPLDREDPRWA